MNESRPPSKVTLEDLLRLKRTERPPAEFWTQFESEFRSRQLAAAVERKPWWFSLSGIFSSIPRFSMPVGAAAVLAVTFLTIRDYRQTAIEPAFSPALANAEMEAPGLAAAARQPGMTAPEYEAAPEVMRIAAQPEILQEVPAVAPTATEASPRIRVSELLVASLQDQVLPPSARSILANLEAVQFEHAQFLDSRMADSRANPTVEIAVSTPREQLVRRLIPENPSIVSYTAGHDPSVSNNRIARTLSESELYPAPRRTHTNVSVRQNGGWRNSLGLSVF